MVRPRVERPLRLLLFGDGAWAADALARLAQGRHCVVGAIVREHPSDLTLAETACALGVPVLRPHDVNDPGFVDSLRSLAPDLGLSIAYDQIFHRPALDSAPLGFLNFHAGDLPCYRGRNVINWAIINGETAVGLTVHFVGEGIDSGDILLQRALPIGWTETYGDVLRRVVEAMPSLVAEAVDLVADGSFVTKPQAGQLGTYFAGREEGDEWLDWSDSSYNLHNKVRGIGRPGPGARTLLGRQVVVVWRAFYDRSWPKYIATPGQVVGRSPGAGALVKTGDSTLLVQEAQVGGGESMAPCWRIGTRLGLNMAQSLQTMLERLERLEARCS